MRKQLLPTRREFTISALKSTAVAASMASGATAVAQTLEQSSTLPPLNVYKAVKWGMIRDAKTVLDKFQICKELGYDGMELISPADFTAAEVRKASEATGMPVHGVVDMRHWQIRLSSLDAQVRSEGVEILKRAIQDSHDFGGDTVLLVPGRVTGADENHDHVWQRSIAGIRQVLPLASRLGVRVLIENVWNGFCESPEELRDYVDEIASPWVGVYFDIGNAQKFRPSQEWIRVLGKRIVKLDVKGWGQKNGFGKIGDGDVDWLKVCRALREIGFSGWATAEVKGGDRARLQEIKTRLDSHLS